MSDKSRKSAFFDLKATHNPNRWTLEVTPSVCVGPPRNLFMFGGVGLAASIKAMEGTTGRRVIWAAAQYLSFARPGSIVDVDVEVPVTGRFNSQARSRAHVGDQEIITASAALGERPDDLSEQWATMPDVPKPEDCPPMERAQRHDEELHDHMELRVAKGRYGEARKDGQMSDDGEVYLWARPKDGRVIDSGMLAIIADFIPSAVGNAIGKNAGGNSLDNTIRIRHVVPTDWVLCDTKIHGVHGGFAHGRMLQFSQDGELMATASQSMIVRVHD